jgi:hypothetical protein
MAYTNIDDPSAYFQTKLWTGNGSTSTGITITNDGNSDLQPDLIWNKQRTAASHGLWDSSRGISRSLTSDNTNAEQYNAGKGITSFNTNGFTGVREGWVQFNRSAEPYVAWQWKANGGTTASNTSGATTTTVQANQDAGFSIVTWTGNGATTTLGHGLGVKPDVIIVKAKGTTSNWAVYHKNSELVAGQPYNSEIWLNSTIATSSAPGSWGTSSSDVNSNTFALKYWFNVSSTLVAYCFAEKQGYSKFGKYVGNGSSDGNGTFVYTGFAPRFVMIKRTDGANDWILHDYKLGTLASTGSEKGNVGNVNSAALRANENSATDDWGSIDMLSNGFKARSDAASINASGGTYIYMAFAEHPFTTSTGIPTTAR